MKPRALKISIPFYWDEQAIEYLAKGRAFDTQEAFEDFCLDVTKEIVKKACESEQIFYMMDVEWLRTRP